MNSNPSFNPMTTPLSFSTMNSNSSSASCPAPLGNFTPGSLADRGYFMPAEWEPHSATWITWPHSERNWPGRFEPIPDVFAQMVKALAPGERVHINVLDDENEATARRFLARHNALAGLPPDTVVFHRIPNNDPWMRDCGPIFVKNRDVARAPIALHWGYNAWGGKYPPYDLDERVAARAAAALGVDEVQPGMILEGGSIEVNGDGALLTTESVLLNPNRNPSLDRAAIEQRLRDFLGVRKILWLGDGIAGDDTDGHVDDLTRFVSADTIVTVVEDNPDDENYDALQVNLERLRRMTDVHGRPFRILELPMPDPVVYEDQRLPASYANFYIGNRAVLLPQYDCPEKDDRARAILAECFPERKVVPIRCVDLIWGLGAFHCLTQQVPAFATENG